jgi:hypothetical protein
MLAFVAEFFGFYSPNHSGTVSPTRLRLKGERNESFYRQIGWLWRL